MLLSVVFVLIICLLFSFTYIKSKWKQIDLPGPKGLPLVGCAFEFFGDIGLHEVVGKWAKQYGDVFKCRMLNKDIVIVSGKANIYEILVKNSNDFAGRPYHYIFTDLMLFNEVIFGDFGDKFMKRKKIGLRGVKQHGDGVTAITKLAKMEANRCVEQMQLHHGKPFDPKDKFVTFTLRVMLNLILGESISLTEDQISSCKQWEQRSVNLLSEPTNMLLDLMPWTRYFGNAAQKQILSALKLRDKQINGWITEQRSNSSEEKTLLAELLTAERNGIVSHQSVIGVVHDAIAAGIFTTSGTSCALLLVLLNRPDIQKRLQKEVDDVVGSDRQPDLTDRDNMPYVQACTMEILRYSSIVALSVPHKATCDTSINGHFIPRGTEVWPNLYGMHHDPRYYTNPEDFDPTRFLKEDGTVVDPGEMAFLPFGAGRRVCMGEVLAKTRMFLLLTQLFQKLDFLPADPDNIPSDNMSTFTWVRTTGALMPPPFTVIAKDRIKL